MPGIGAAPLYGTRDRRQRPYERPELLPERSNSGPSPSGAANSATAVYAPVAPRVRSLGVSHAPGSSCALTAQCIRTVCPPGAIMLRTELSSRPVALR